MQFRLILCLIISFGQPLLAGISHTFSENSYILPTDLAAQIGEAVLHGDCPHLSEQQSQSPEVQFSPRMCEKYRLGSPRNPETLQTQILQKKINQVSLHEKICMRHFFDFIIKIDQAGHVLCFDTKPVCLTCLALKDKHKSFNDILCLKGWIAFKKHEASFPHPNFIFNEILFDDGDCKILDIYIINKSALKKCLIANESLFKTCLDDSFNIEIFIKQLENGQNLISLINEDELLLGILMGFGEEASRAYQVQNINGRSSTPKWSDHYCRVAAQQPKRCKIYSVAFMGNPNSSEIKRLISVYEKELQSIWNDYQTKNDSLTFFLEHLCKEEIYFSAEDFRVGNQA